MGMDVMAKMLRLAGQAMNEGFGFHHGELYVFANLMKWASIVWGDVYPSNNLTIINFTQLICHLR
jgi:hypothetical protein